jgi:hypothetical protein
MVYSGRLNEPQVTCIYSIAKSKIATGLLRLTQQDISHTLLAVFLQQKLLLRVSIKKCNMIP